jgi:hypothetical protein
MKVAWWKRALAILLGKRIVHRFQELRHNHKHAILERMVLDAKQCESRQNLEEILGKPKYALDGKLYKIGPRGGEESRPDCVEVYSIRGCTFDVLFFPKQQRHEVFGAVLPSSIDMLLLETVANES